MKTIKIRYIWESPEHATKRYEYTLDELESRDLSYVRADYEMSDWKLLDRLQFTGLLDKNGREIYEGDVVTHNQFPTPLFVKWDYDQWGLFDGINNEASIGKDDVEIIGNVYENNNRPDIRDGNKNIQKDKSDIKE